MKKYLLELSNNKTVRLTLLILIFLIVLSIGFLLCFLGNNIYPRVIIPFHNTDGKFDYSIFWSAIIGIATLILSFVVAWNSHRYQKMTTESSEEYQRQIVESSREHQAQIEKFSKANADLMDKLVHLETFKYFPQVKVSLSGRVHIQSEEFIQLYCNTRHLYNLKKMKKETDEQITLIHCQLENVGMSYVDEILYKEIVIIMTSYDGKKQIVYQGKPVATGCSSLFVNSSKNLLISFPKALLIDNSNHIEVITHYQVKNGKEQLWVTDWVNQIYSEIIENNRIRNLHCTSTRLSHATFNDFIQKTIIRDL